MRKVLLCLLCFGLLTGCANAPKQSDNANNEVTTTTPAETTTTPEVTTTTPAVTTAPETTAPVETTTPVVTTTPMPETTKVPETTKTPEVTKAPETTKATTTTTTKPASSNAIAFDVEDRTIVKGTSFDLVPPEGVTFDITSSEPDVAWVKGYNISAGYTGTSTITVTAHQAGHKDTTKTFKVTVELSKDVVYIEPEQREEAEQLFDLINDEREKLGIPRWTWDEDLYELATIRSRDELPESYEHNGPTLASYEPLTQEQILRTSSGKAKDHLFEFRNSDAHWYNMMNNGVYEGSGKTESPFVIGENRAAIAIWFNKKKGYYYTTIIHRN